MNVGKDSARSGPGTVVVRERSGRLVVGGVLSIVGGALGLLGALMYLFVWSLFWGGDYGGEIGGEQEAFRALAVHTAPSILCIPAIAGGILALRRTRFRLALAGAICGIFGSPFLIFTSLFANPFLILTSLAAIAATALIATSRDEFKHASYPSDTLTHQPKGAF